MLMKIKYIHNMILLRWQYVNIGAEYVIFQNKITYRLECRYLGV